MNNYISDILAQHFITLSYISKASGCVQTLVKPIKNGEVKYPIVKTAYTVAVGGVVKCDVTQQYHDMIPNEDELGMLYFEDGGVKVIKSNGRYKTYRGSIDLVCWLNLKRIGIDNTIDDLTRSLMANVPQRLDVDGLFYGGNLSVKEIYKKRPSPFDKYGYDESQRQHLLYPNDYVWMKLEYLVRAANTCPVSITINPLAC